jgi:hypothetical protein
MANLKGLLKTILVTMMLTISTTHASDIGLRYNNAVTPEAGLVDLQPSTPGKLLQLKYDNTFLKNFYIEAAGGEFFQKDFDQGTAVALEISPGVQVQAGPVRVRVSQGIATLIRFEFATHISLALVDESGVYIGIERSHYSNGSSIDNPGLNFTGLTFGFKF